MLSSDAPSQPINVKMLLDSGLAGSVIGKAGAAITELTEISGARIKISSSGDCYPGTSDQVIMISGGEDEVDSAQELIWHRIAQHTAWKARGSVGPDTFNPRAMLDSIRRGDITRGQSVTGRILIPLDACGSVIGTNGAYIRTLSDETGVRIQLSPKDDSVALVTQERIVALTGEVEDCIQCTANVIKKMQEDSTAAFANGTPSYLFYQLGLAAGDQRSGGGRASQHSPPGNARAGPGNGSFVPRLPPGLSVVSAVTTLTLSASDAFAGQIIGRKGSVISDLQARSGASITVSVREESADAGQGKRTIVIVGSPDEAQMALRLISQKFSSSADSINTSVASPSKSSYKRNSPPKGGHSKMAF